MIPSGHGHCWMLPAAEGAASAPARNGAGPGLPPAPDPDLRVRCHRRLRGPYTGANGLLRSVVPDLLDVDAGLIAARATEVVTMAVELSPVVPIPPQTLTNLANRAERTRFYSVARTLRLSHGATELLLDWARLVRPQGVVIEFTELDDADPTDREFVSVLLRRCDPRQVTLIVEAGEADDALANALARYAHRVSRPAGAGPQWPPGTDLAQVFIDSDGTGKDPRVLAAYEALSAGERARRHDTRASVLAAMAEPSLRFGAIPYHLSRGSDPAGAGAEAVLAAVEETFDLGCYEATLELAARGRELVAHAQQSEPYWNFTNKVGACLSYLKRGARGFSYFDELRRITAHPDIHMNSCYMMAMLYTRHLPAGDHDEFRALEWVNTAIALADRHPDPHRRVFVGAFMRNARALVELHRGAPEESLALVNEAIAMTDADLGPDEQLLHRSVLLYNRAQILNAMGDFAASLRDYDVVISRDPEYGDYYFERAGVRRSAGRYDEALADYATAIKLSPPFHEAHYNRADLWRELGDAGAALADLDYAAVLDPAHVDTLVNRADLLIERGDTERAWADIEAGLELDPANANLLTAKGSLLADSGDAEGARASYTAALSSDPEFAAAWANRAVLLYAAGAPREAVDDLDQAIALGDDPALRANRAIALADLGEHGRAVADLDVAVGAFNGDAPALLYQRGASKYALGDTDGAVSDWRAHLAGYPPAEVSPYADEISRLAGDLLNGHTAAVHPAGAPGNAV
jgi:tetratricopeptide (TPR) repeat protein